MKSIPLTNLPRPPAGRSAVPVLFVVSGSCSLVAGSILLVLWAPEIVSTQGWNTNHALGLTHLMALGFASSVAIGVLYHLAPRSFGSPPPNQPVGVAVGLCFILSMAAFVVSLSTGSNGAAAIGGPLLAIAILGFLGQMALVVGRGKRRSLTCDFLLVAFTCLGLVAILGSALAISLQLGFIANPLDVLGPKITLAVAGWLGMLIVGVSYQVIPMFTLSRARQRFGRIVFALMFASLIALPLSLGFHAPNFVAELSTLPYLAGVVLYATDVLHFMNKRAQSRLNPTGVGHIVGTLYLLATAMCAIPAAGGILPMPQIAVTGALVGWVPLYIVASATRIIPVLIWEGRGPGKRPRVPAEIPSRLAWWSVGITALAWPLLALAFVLRSGSVGIAAAFSLLAAAVGLCSIGVTAWRTPHTTQSP
jgi:hypothetical protein